MTSPTTEAFHVVTGKESGADHDQVVMEQYIPQPGDEGEKDHLREADKAMASWVLAFIRTRFPCGYEWCVRSDIRQGVVMISLPLLMGVNKWMVINLAKTSLGHGVLMVTGEILERYKLSRTHYDVGALLAAREKHSALILPSRQVPV